MNLFIIENSYHLIIILLMIDANRKDKSKFYNQIELKELEQDEQTN